MSIHTDASGTLPVLHLRGDLDVATASTLEDEVASLGHPESIVLDLTDLVFLDSSGITAIIRLHRLCGSRGGRLAVRRPQPFVADILRLAGLDRVVDIDPT